MTSDILFTNIVDPIERKRLLAENAATVIKELKESAVDRGDFDTVNQLSFLGQTIKALSSL